MLTSIISAVVILGTLVLIHEAGHFAVAKRCGVRVLRFSIGYPPKLFGFRRGETEYAIGGPPLAVMCGCWGMKSATNWDPSTLRST